MCLPNLSEVGKLTISVSHGGISDVKSHSNGKTHLALENSLRTREQTTLYFGKKTSSVENEFVITNSDRNQLPEENIGSALATEPSVPFWYRFSLKYNP